MTDFTDNEREESQPVQTGEPTDVLAEETSFAALDEAQEAVAEDAVA